jgi:predicted DNA-binding antitoxin AbrB/MazE fold protein
MAAQKSWAVYHDGQLQLLDPLDLAEGQRVQVSIIRESDEVVPVPDNGLTQAPSSREEDASSDEIATLRRLNDARVAAALGDLLMKIPPAPEDDEELDEEAILRGLDEATRGLIPPTSELIIEERRNGP